jgi:hypothetical protein
VGHWGIIYWHSLWCTKYRSCSFDIEGMAVEGNPQSPLFAVGLLGGNLLRLLFLGLKERADPFEEIGAEDKRRRDDGLATCNVAFTAALLVFILVRVESPGLGGVGGLQRPVHVAEDCALDLLSLRLDNGHALVEFCEELVTELVGLGHVGLCDGRRSLEVGKGGLDKFGVAGVGQLNRFRAVGILLVGLDGI